MRQTTTAPSLLAIAAITACSSGVADHAPSAAPHQSMTARAIAEPLAAGLARPLPRVEVSQSFRDHWRDGRAEISGYDVTTIRYGKPRRGQAVLIYVAEPMDRRSWIKDDRGTLTKPHRVEVLKLNHLLTFRTGIYPYRVMTSVFSPLDGLGRERFAPAKIVATAQEWCGQVFQQIHPKGTHFHSTLHSYFQAEGHRRETVRTAPLALYEDALLIQLRELDGPFADGGDWRGELVPSLWWARKRHRPLRSLPAAIERRAARRGSTPVTRFTVRYGGETRVIDVERAFPRRVLGWRRSDGERAVLRRTARLTYWKLNGPGGERYLEQVGLTPCSPAGACAAAPARRGRRTADAR